MKGFQVGLLTVMLLMVVGAESMAEEAKKGDDALLQVLHQLPADPVPKELTRNSHYVVSDEKRHDLYRPVIKDRGGVYLGVGTNQNYEMMGWARSSIGIMLDFDQMVVDLHLAYRVAFLNSPTPADFIKYWKNDDKTFKADATRILQDEDKVKAALRAYTYSQKLVNQRLKATVRRDKRENGESFVSSQVQYDYILEMVNENRIVMVRGDLTAEKTMLAISKALEAHGEVLSIYYVSNCEQYFPFTENYRKNIVEMPSNEKSLVLRTRPWREFLEGTRKPEGPLRYTYTYQPMSILQDWMKNKRIQKIYDMIPRDRILGKAVRFNKPAPQ